uniref:Uncharacterized protein n=1 Tax=Branchiostoma floridae TaxID=7739 RepID=C3YXV6_BRAFL|eukprot:XP_002598903.1 hypothetical protein BRAFLDRAFT_107337 [Branchiostoma floridae]
MVMLGCKVTLVEVKVTAVPTAVNDCASLSPDDEDDDIFGRYGDDACGYGDQPCTKRQKLAGATVEVSQDLMSGDPSLSSESDVDDTSTPQVMSELRKQKLAGATVEVSQDLMSGDPSLSSESDVDDTSTPQVMSELRKKEDKEDTEIWSDAEMEEDTLDFQRGTDMEDINDAGQTESNMFMPLICLLLLLLAKWKPGRISKIWKVFVFLEAEETERKIEHTVAEVRWFKEAPSAKLPSAMVGPGGRRTTTALRGPPNTVGKLVTVA